MIIKINKSCMSTQYKNSDTFTRLKQIIAKPPSRHRKKCTEHKAGGSISFTSPIPKIFHP